MDLKEHTVKSYDKDLKSIAETLETMLEMVMESIDMVAEMIKTRDEALIEKITVHDYKINALDHLIEKKDWFNYGFSVQNFQNYQAHSYFYSFHYQPN